MFLLDIGSEFGKKKGKKMRKACVFHDGCGSHVSLALGTMARHI